MCHRDAGSSFNSRETLMADCTDFDVFSDDFDGLKGCCEEQYLRIRVSQI